MKLTNKKIKYFLRDEKKAIKEYRKYGLFKLARDEAKHSRILRRKMKGGKI